MNNFCLCEDWNKNINTVTAFLLFGIEFGFNEEVESLTPFKFCPWCGSKLLKIEDLEYGHEERN